MPERRRVCEEEKEQPQAEAKPEEDKTPWVDDGIRPGPINPVEAGGVYVVDLFKETPDPDYYKNALLSGELQGRSPLREQ